MCKTGGSNSQPFNPHRSSSLSASVVGTSSILEEPRARFPSNQYLLTSIDEYSKLYKIVNIIHSTVLIKQLYSLLDILSSVNCKLPILVISSYFALFYLILEPIILIVHVSS